jgi:hypothetical protein
MMMIVSDGVQDGYTCLHATCFGGKLEVAKYLCEWGGEALLMKTDNVSVSLGWQEISNSTIVTCFDHLRIILSSTNLAYIVCIDVHVGL